eukprot:gb/GEZN01000960.1/.p1 GENE.gb/GEZN01000960.1/~~gb/GEZN01000960.1/.p1  ORF type:complete len:1102 (-),score=216.10 gb/GEZN01000960.1/:15-3320(-)
MRRDGGINRQPARGMQDADSDDDDLKLIGTTFEEEGADGIWKADSTNSSASSSSSLSAEAPDDPTHGGKRFHGAFTGGFTAGYFNSVGTKEGWTPATFSSSRSSRAEAKAARPEDFMDSEDLGEQAIAGETLRARSDFTSSDSGLSQMDSRLQDVLVAPEDSVGIQLLRQMGWREGQGVGAKVPKQEPQADSTTPVARVLGAMLPPHMRGTDVDLDETGPEAGGQADSRRAGPPINSASCWEAQREVGLYRTKRKDDDYGLGFDPRAANPEMHSSSAMAFRNGGEAMREVNEAVGLGLGSVGRSQNHQAGGAFGLGALESVDGDENIYGSDSLSNYDIELKVERKPSRFDQGIRAAAVAASGRNIQFVTAQSQPAPVKTWPRLVVPAEFITMRRWQGPDLELTADVQALASKFLLGPGAQAAPRPNTQLEGEPTLDHRARAEMLGEAALPVRHVTPSLPSCEPAAKREIRGRGSKWDVKSDADQPAVQPGGVFGLMSASDRDKLARSLASNFQVSDLVLPDEPAGLVASSSERRAALEKAEFQFPTEPEKQARWLHYLSWARSQQLLQHGNAKASIYVPAPNTQLTLFQQQSERAEFDSLISRHRLVIVPGGASRAPVPVTTQVAGPVDIGSVRDRATRFIEDAVAGTTAERVSKSSQEMDFAQAASKGLYGPLTRATKQWRPARLLCKRFNLPDPYEGVAAEDLEENPLTASEQQFNEMLELAQAHSRPKDFKENRQRLQQKLQQKPPSSSCAPGSFRSSSSSISSSSSSSFSGLSASQLLGAVLPQEQPQSLGSVTPNYVAPVPGLTIQSELDQIEKPPVDLFKAIFLSEDVSGSEDEAEDEQDGHAMVDTDGAAPGLLALPAPDMQKTQAPVLSRPASSRWGLGSGTASVRDPLPRLMGREYPLIEQTVGDQSDPVALEQKRSAAVAVAAAISLRAQKQKEGREELREDMAIKAERDVQAELETEMQAKREAEVLSRLREERQSRHELKAKQDEAEEDGRNRKERHRDRDRERDRDIDRDRDKGRQAERTVKEEPKRVRKEEPEQPNVPKPLSQDLLKELLLSYEKEKKRKEKKKAKKKEKEKEKFKKEKKKKKARDT